MNAQFEFLRTKAAPLALGTAIALAFGASATAQAQYQYPGTVNSNTHTAHASPVRAGATNPDADTRTDGNGPCPTLSPATCGGPRHGGSNDDGSSGTAPGTPQSASYGYGQSAPHEANGIHPIRARAVENGGHGSPHSGRNSNPSMQSGEACPPGSQCAHPQTGGSGSSHSSSAYGAQESYGATPVQSTREANAGRAVPAGKASISPVQSGVGRGALNHGPMQNSNADFRNSVTGKSSGPNTNVTGQQTSFTGPDGKQVNVGNPTSFTGPNGKKQSFDQTPDLSGAGYGHQKGSGINNGVSYTTQDGSMTEHRTGSAPGVASATGMNLGNGGVAGVSDQPADAPSKPTGKANSGGQADGSGNGEDLNSINDEWGHPHDGKDSQGNDWSGGKLVNGFDDQGVKYRGGKPVPGGNVPGYKSNSDSGDMGPNYGPGEIVSGTGQVVQPGKKPGQDDGGGQTDDGTSHSGGQNAQGRYVAPSGQDASAKPKEKGVLKVDYNGKNGAIDPKLNGTGGGG